MSCSLEAQKCSVSRGWWLQCMYLKVAIIILPGIFIQPLLCCWCFFFVGLILSFWTLFYYFLNRRIHLINNKKIIFLSVIMAVNRRGQHSVKVGSLFVLPVMVSGISGWLFMFCELPCSSNRVFKVKNVRKKQQSAVWSQRWPCSGLCVSHAW